MSRARGRTRALAAGCLLVIALFAPGTVSADVNGEIGAAYSDGAAVSIVSVTFDNKLVATVTLELSCEAFDHDWSGAPVDPAVSDGHLYGWIELIQAQGKNIAHASGVIQPSGGAMNSPGPDVTCDGSTFEIAVQVVAQSLPLHRGEAVVGADVGMNAAACCSYAGNSAASGPTLVRIR